jgi:hypothetical protein
VDVFIAMGRNGSGQHFPIAVTDNLDLAKEATEDYSVGMVLKVRLNDIESEAVEVAYTNRKGCT